MNGRHVCHRPRVVMALTLTLTISAATGCCLARPQLSADGTTADMHVATETVPILVTLVEEGEALAGARTRVLAKLEVVMSASAFAAVRTYESLPLIALAATPEVVALLLTLTDVRSVEADRSVDAL